jgi:protein-S-isoprenylcysteine O-methyltransferase Ste14
VPHTSLTPGVIAACYFTLSRLAYVVGVGVMLAGQDRSRRLTERHGVEGGYRRFRRIAAFLMTNDGIAFVALALLTRDTLPAGVVEAVPRAAMVAVGLVLIVIGAGVKLWAARTLGDDGYHWRNFFLPDAPIPQAGGPYRYLRNPMYTVGYLQTYGLALVLASLPALVAAGFAQASVLLFHWLVERPHYRRVTGDR